MINTPMPVAIQIIESLIQDSSTLIQPPETHHLATATGSGKSAIAGLLDSKDVDGVVTR
jgi:hypothetical protein